MTPLRLLPIRPSVSTHSTRSEIVFDALAGAVLALGSLIFGGLDAARAADAAPGPAARPALTVTNKPPPLAPGGKWRVHDTNRPQPVVIMPPTASTPDRPGQPPSDAIVLFDGTDLSQWETRTRTGSAPAKWKVENGYMEIVPKSGSIRTKQQFADCQLHLEWATPAEVKGSGQGRGNSGLYFQGHPEIQLLDSWENTTYPDGQAAALYGLYPPLVNASRKPGEWQSFDVIYMAPRFDENQKLVKPALYTVFHNGVLVHHAVEVPGTAVECAILLQDHGNPLRFRNIWVRKLRGYDER